MAGHSTQGVVGLNFGTSPVSNRSIRSRCELHHYKNAGIFDRGVRDGGRMPGRPSPPALPRAPGPTRGLGCASPTFTLSPSRPPAPGLGPGAFFVFARSCLSRARSIRSAWRASHVVVRPVGGRRRKAQESGRHPTRERSRANGYANSHEPRAPGSVRIVCVNTCLGEAGLVSLAGPHIENVQVDRLLPKPFAVPASHEDG